MPKQIYKAKLIKQMPKQTSTAKNVDDSLAKQGMPNVDPIYGNLSA